MPDSEDRIASRRIINNVPEYSVVYDSSGHTKRVRLPSLIPIPPDNLIEFIEREFSDRYSNLRISAMIEPERYQK